MSDGAKQGEVMEDLQPVAKDYMPHSTLRTSRYAVKEGFRISSCQRGGGNVLALPHYDSM
jgi:hypothetical protein